MAEINNLSVATLRLYDKLDLIKLEYVVMKLTIDSMILDKIHASI